MSNSRLYTEMFDYLSAEELPQTPEPSIVFGRQDERVAQAVGDLVIPGLAKTIVITGGIGKDSGNLLEQGFASEAGYLHAALQADAVKRSYELPFVHLDELASNGGENARNSLDILNQQGFGGFSLTAVAHATSLRRLAETLKFEAGKKQGNEPEVHTKASAYDFNVEDPDDRNEAMAEFLRLVNWPAKGMLSEQTDLPENLVDFASDSGIKAPAPVKLWQSALLARLSPQNKERAINFASKLGRK